MTDTNSRIANRLRFAFRALAVITSAFWATFSLLSGAASGITGFINNLPNSLPFVLLLLTVWFAFLRERLGGSLLILFGASSIPFFEAWASLAVLFGLSLPIILAGVGLILCSARNETAR